MRVTPRRSSASSCGVPALFQAASAFVVRPCTNSPEQMCIRDRRQSGVKVDVYSDKRVAGTKSHGKILLLDSKRAVVGSMALTALCLDFRREVAVMVDDAAAVADIDKFFRSIDAAAGTPRGATAAGGASC